MKTEILTKKKLKRLLKDPLLLFKYPLHMLQREVIRKRFIKQFCSNGQEFNNYHDELKKSGLPKHIQKAKQKFTKMVKGKTSKGAELSFGGMGKKDSLFLYILIRKLKPKVLIETGVCNGVSTSIILQALKNNKAGKLYSIDLPRNTNKVYKANIFTQEHIDGSAILKNNSPGWIVPKELRKNWKLILGRSQDKLPPLLKKIGKIDFFMHDSEHSYKCMAFEFNLSYKYLKEGGLIVSDDVRWNKAFHDFCKKYNLRIFNISANIGFCFKNIKNNN